MPFDPDDFRLFRQYLEKNCGVLIGERLEYELDSRLARLMVELQTDTVAAVLERAKAEPGSNLENRILEAVVTHETAWFRDHDFWRVLRAEVLPAMLREAWAGRRPPLRALSAGCSAGQEPYSLAMAVERLRPKEAPVDAFKVVAIDISSAVLYLANSGRFSRVEVARGLPPEYRERFLKESGKATWDVDPSVRARVEFLNRSLKNPLDDLGPFDLVLCRHLLDAYTPEAREPMLENILKVLAPGGWLVLDRTESIAPRSDITPIEMHGITLYRKTSAQ